MAGNKTSEEDKKVVQIKATTGAWWKSTAAPDSTTVPEEQPAAPKRAPRKRAPRRKAPAALPAEVNQLPAPEEGVVSGESGAKVVLEEPLSSGKRPARKRPPRKRQGVAKKNAEVQVDISLSDGLEVGEAGRQPEGALEVNNEEEGQGTKEKNKARGGRGRRGRRGGEKSDTAR